MSEFIWDGTHQKRVERESSAELLLERELLPAIESLERGEGLEATPEFWERLRQDARRRLSEAQDALQDPE